jgi:hypothetical protein
MENISSTDFSAHFVAVQVNTNNVYSQALEGAV